MKYSLNNIVTQKSVDYKKDCRSKFGSYVEDNIDDMVTNGQTPQTHICITLGTSITMKKSLKCFDLKSVKVVTINFFRSIHMYDIVVKLVNNWECNTKGKI